MRAGRLRHRVSIEQFSATTDEVGDPVETWTPVDTVWANVLPISGREFFASKQVNAETTHRVFMRYRAALTANHRLVFQGRVLDISAPPINIGERNIELEIHCTEVS